MTPPTPQHLLDRARRLAGTGERRILGIAGPPGAGKSTLAARLVEALEGRAVLVPMDGFHLAGTELRRLGRADRKGAPDTFDEAGYVALLTRLRTPDGDTVYAPAFDRALEEPVAGSVAVPPDVPLVVTEGNYLLHWPRARALLDEAWFLAPDSDVRVRRLVARHIGHGRSREAAEAWVHRSDEANTRTVERTRDRADLIVSHL
ncbi:MULTISPECIES: nucleoside/nucleotide kinase family protein [unclassified Streptomyces]|uniref:nucleoside/nucleotide kinase family protein n=1 Tax=unclassified Streptomyces TaxID=2593676 RepID=UPI0022551282|nr:nucleoside/nucleotide kinase family protein [Streptomyces sp. NBC_01500]MCX4547412.1 nucleoside/nucleotide kinase family protein [Streptomyces sp. NBC_01500]WSV53161.1 nucleoside/nucleotide kinase family protein [Streptomyces sp. NBC_01014]